MTVTLHGLDENAEYVCENADGGCDLSMGRTLMEKGLTVRIEQPHSSAVIRIRREA